MRHGASRVHLLVAMSCVGLVLEWAGSAPVEAGTFIFADEAHVDRVTHPSNYDGTGGEIVVTVCIDPTATNAGSLVIPIKNIVRELNAFAPASPNLFSGAENNIPSNAIDFESLTLHELGHCVGLGHPNLATESGLTDADQDYTKSTDGANNTFNINSGADTVIGSGDDLRGDDVNLHYFEAGVNHPFLMPLEVDQTTYTRDVAELPAGDNFPANASRDVGELLGSPDTEAVMQQGQFMDEDQRMMQADDVATLMYAMTGLDETIGTADDYTIDMQYVGLTDSCDIVVDSRNTGFGSCSVGGTSIDFANFPNHLAISGATFNYNPNAVTWFYNQTLRCDDLRLNWSHNQMLKHHACGDLVLENGFTIGANGIVKLKAGGSVSFEPGVSIAGTLSVTPGVPVPP